MKPFNDLIKQKEKVFCSECKHYRKNNAGHLCLKVKRDTFEARNSVPGNAKKINRHNDCKVFEKI